ncbi:MAG TPA: hypothetical protein ENH10_10275, partial [Bacteroidetes bacterium]|nr:hypothetical protein [Bacteroidota bacterium]HEX05517.1 hypothetical protein [Bacteroidota bacterium]
MMRTSFLLLIVLVLSFGSAIARDFEVVTNVEDLEAFAAEYSARWESWRGPAFLEAQQMTTGIFGQINADPDLVLVGVDENGK